jgi:rhodanese-related sulfurtransferase
MFGFFKGLKQTSSIKMQDLDEYIGKVNLIDVRSSSEFKVKSIKTAVNVPGNLLVLNPEMYLDKEQEYYVYCLSGSRSKAVCAKLNGEGYKLIDITGGLRTYSGENFL